MHKQASSQKCLSGSLHVVIHRGHALRGSSLLCSCGPISQQPAEAWYAPDTSSSSRTCITLLTTQTQAEMHPTVVP